MKGREGLREYLLPFLRNFIYYLKTRFLCVPIIITETLTFDKELSSLIFSNLPSCWLYLFRSWGSWVSVSDDVSLQDCLQTPCGVTPIVYVCHLLPTSVSRFKFQFRDKGLVDPFGRGETVTVYVSSTDLVNKWSILRYLRKDLLIFIIESLLRIISTTSDSLVVPFRNLLISSIFP